MTYTSFKTPCLYIKDTSNVSRLHVFQIQFIFGTVAFYVFFIINFVSFVISTCMQNDTESKMFISAIYKTR